MTASSSSNLWSIVKTFMSRQEMKITLSEICARQKMKKSCSARVSKDCLRFRCCMWTSIFNESTQHHSWTRYITCFELRDWNFEPHFHASPFQKFRFSWTLIYTSVYTAFSSRCTVAWIALIARKNDCMDFFSYIKHLAFIIRSGGSYKVMITGEIFVSRSKIMSN